MNVSLFIQITLIIIFFVMVFGGLLLIPLIMYAYTGMCKLTAGMYNLFTNRKEPQMKPLHLKEHIFNLDAIVMIEPYDDGGLVHCTDNHAYRISEAEYQELRKLLGKE